MRYKVNVQKPVVFLYATSKTSEKEIKETTLTMIASKTIKPLEINLIEEVKALYTENWKTLMQGIGADKQMESYLVLMD